MGGRVSTNTAPSRYQFDPRPWALIGEGDNYRILRNTSNGEELEEYLHTATDNKEFDHLRNMFEYRLDKDYLVATKYFRQENRNEMCSTFFQGFLYTERIPLRMNEIKDLPFPDTLHLVNACLRGFRELYSKTGGFEINDHMIGINSDAKVKVWMSQDFGADRPFDSGKRDERIMVCQIVEIIDKNIDRRTEPQSITQALTRNGPPSFDQALALLNQYTIRNVISIPPYLASIAELRDKGYFKKMPAKGRLMGSTRSPLDPSINRSLALAAGSILSSGNNNVIVAMPNQPISSEVMIANSALPPPKSVTFNQSVQILNPAYGASQAPVLSPLAVPLVSANLQKIFPINTEVHQTQLPYHYDGVPPAIHNHLQYQGKQPLTMFTQKYPPPNDYSPLQPPPAHLKSHKTQVRSFMSPPIVIEGGVEKMIQAQAPSTLIRPGTPVFGQMNTNYVQASTSPVFNQAQPTNNYPVSTLTTQHLKSTSLVPTYDPSILVNKYLHQQPFQYHKSQKLLSSSNLPMIVIPNKIELTVTKITNRQPEGVAVENFILNPNQNNVHSGLIKQILQHTIGLQNALKQGAFYNPTIQGQKMIEEIKLNDSKDYLSRATTANFTQYSQSSSRKDLNGHTDPELLSRTIKGLANIIDTQKPLLPISQFEFSSAAFNDYEDKYENRYQNLGGFQSFNIKPSEGQPVFSLSSSDKSSPEIMALVSQALNGKKDFEKGKYKMSEISEIESVDYDSRYGSHIRS